MVLEPMPVERTSLLRKGSPIYFEVGKPISTKGWTLESAQEQISLLHREVKSLIAKAKVKREKALKIREKENHFKDDNFSTKTL